MKHLSVKQLWMQERVDLGDFEIEKVLWSVNSGDLLTHHWTRLEGDAHLKRIGVEVRLHE